ncbi:MAG TPA: sugar ABC transporter ATP-binding protein [Mucilaginibacter sp.]|jgi:ribose transport system ATP-binding protein
MLVAQNITKKFSGVTALDNVCLELYAGKVNAILGENGAGKSTLMKILSGVYPDYEGKVLLNGKQVNFSNPREAQHAGIAIIHQELNLVSHLSITENVFLGREIVNSWGMLNKQAMHNKTRELLNRLKLSVGADTLVVDLKVGQQQVVEIAKALLTDCDVIIMDEPTSAISESEVDVLFEIIEDLRRENKAIVYISHKLDELFKIADRYIVLRDGCTIESGDMKGMTHDALIHKMVGRELNVIQKGDNRSADAPLLSVQHINLQHPENSKRLLLKDLSFNLFKGEVLGIFGLMGAGRTELLETIFGLNHQSANGELQVEQKAVNFKSPAEAMKAGITLVPEDRKKHGLILGLDVKTNIGLTTLETMQSFGWLNEAKEERLAKKYIEVLKIKTPSTTQTVKNLSGGNQQKVVLAKCLATGPKVLMLDEPTRGIDINAKNEIYKLIRELAADGLGVIVVSSELPEILAISDRILVMAEGNLTAEFTAAEATEDKILKAAIPNSI